MIGVELLMSLNAGFVYQHKFLMTRTATQTSKVYKVYKDVYGI